MFADSAINNLKESGVNTNLIQRVPNINTGCAVITVDEKGISFIGLNKTPLTKIEFKVKIIS